MFCLKYVNYSAQSRVIVRLVSLYLATLLFFFVSRAVTYTFYSNITMPNYAYANYTDNSVDCS